MAGLKVSQFVIPPTPPTALDLVGLKQLMETVRAVQHIDCS
jgi:cellulose biosynthesis protein BcsQ